MRKPAEHTPHLIGRRDFIKFTGAAGGLELLRQFLPGIPTIQAAIQRKMKPIIGIWLDGGMSQLDSWDFHPDAPEGIRGPLTAIRTKTGAIFSSWFSKLAERAERFTLLRAMDAETAGAHSDAYEEAMYAKSGKHLFAEHCMQQAGKPYVVTDYLSDSSFALEAQFFKRYEAIQIDWDAGQKRYAPPQFQEVEPWEVRVSLEERKKKLREKFALLRALEEHRTIEGTSIKDFHEKRERAHDLLMGTLPSFTPPTPKELTQYGDNPIGQAALIARKLAAQGTVGAIAIRTGDWDFHGNLYEESPEQSAHLDQAIAALIDDLRREWDGLLFVRGEFGREPTIGSLRKGDRGPGRDHFRAHAGIFAGGPFHEGLVYGSTNRRGELSDGAVTNRAFTDLLLQAAGAPPDPSNPLPPILKKE